MIYYATLIRLSDGTPLSATTDDNTDTILSHAKKTIKLLAQQLSKQPSRICIQEENCTILCMHSVVVGFVAVCQPTFSHLLAYSFLDELRKEFNVLYNTSVVAAVRRPYAFIEFDSFLQKVRLKYNSPQYVAARVNLPELRAELSLHPPVVMSSCNLVPPALNHHLDGPMHTTLSLANGSIPDRGTSDQSQVGVSLHLVPLNLTGRITTVLAFLLLLLDAYRAVSSISQSSFEEYDGPSPFHGLGFLLELFILSIQLRLLWRYHRFRKLLSVACVLLQTLVSLCLLMSVRDTWLTAAYFAVSISLTFHTLNRSFRKLSRFNV